MYHPAGLNVLLSGGADEFGIANIAYGILISPFVSFLSLNQPPYPYPPNPQVFEGQYSYATIMAKIFTKDEQLFLQTNGQTTYLAYRSEPLKLQVSDQQVLAMLGIKTAYVYSPDWNF